MKKIIQATAAALSLTFVVSAVVPKRAEAIVGLATGNVPAIVIGASLIAAGGLTAAIGVPVVAHRCHHSGPMDFSCGFTMFIPAGTAILSALVGLIILDESNGGLPQFQTLTLEQQDRLAVTADEYTVYESELEEISAAISAGAAEAIAANVQTAEQAKSFFDAEYSNLSPETRSVMSKIVRQ